MASTTENPVAFEIARRNPSAEGQEGAEQGSHGVATSWTSDVEAAVALLKDSHSTQPETVQAMEAALRSHEAELRAEFEAKLARLETQLTRGEGDALLSSVRSVFAHLSEAPPNWHQVTVLFASSAQEQKGGGAEAGARRPHAVSLAISVLIVVSQSMVVVGLGVGTSEPSCRTSNDCELKGAYCRVGDGDRCTYCGEMTPLPLHFNTTLVAEVCADPTAAAVQANDREGFAFWNAAGVASWCHSCVFNDGMVDELTATSHAQSTRDVMGPFDWIALILCTVVVALTVGGELKV
jgi:hypothetical protein